MLESMYCGDEQIEAKYLQNFSPEERVVFFRHIHRNNQYMDEYQEKLDKMIAEDSTAIFSNELATPNSSLDIKYVLNRIAANDPRDIAFTLGETDAMYLRQNPDRLALDIANAFHKNNVCKTVVLRGLGLTDRGMVPLLRALSHNQLTLLDISNNDIAEKSIQTLEHILADPNTKWERVKLGKIKLDKVQEGALAKQPKLSFEAITPLSQKIRLKWNNILSATRMR